MTAGAIINLFLSMMPSFAKGSNELLTGKETNLSRWFGSRISTMKICDGSLRHGIQCFISNS